jgi:Uncharacterized conserved protein
MIFLTLGSQKFQFNRLLKEVDQLISKQIITDKVFAQTGYSDYRPDHFEFENFLDRQEFALMEARSDIVITHGGTGAIIGAVKSGKKVIAVPRLARFGEHVDDHQVQLIQQFDEMKIIEACYELAHLELAYRKVLINEYKMYQSNTENIIKNIDEFVQNKE